MYPRNPEQLLRRKKLLELNIQREMLLLNDTYRKLRPCNHCVTTIDIFNSDLNVRGLINLKDPLEILCANTFDARYLSKMFDDLNNFPIKVRSNENESLHSCMNVISACLDIIIEAYKELDQIADLIPRDEIVLEAGQSQNANAFFADRGMEEKIAQPQPSYADLLARIEKLEIENQTMRKELNELRYVPGEEPEPDVGSSLSL
ncbi:MAG: hypothetical protein SFW66_06360 [Gammaproteobacteria bacterium]|nr:hypothetical protein [Gammaproteobacteria bacterium]